MVNKSAHIEGVIEEYFEIGTGILRTLSAGGFQATERGTGRSLVLWIMRQSLGVNTQAVGEFLQRMSRIQALGAAVSDLESYGVDSKGSAFAVFPQLDGQPLLSFELDAAEKERRLIGAYQSIDILHRADLCCGDICPDSFWISRDGQVRLLGVMGQQHDIDRDYATKEKLVQFIAPEQLNGSAPSMIGDVFSLGVVTHLLYTRRFPSLDQGENESKGNQQLVSHLVKGVPLWVDDVLRGMLTVDPQHRFASVPLVLEEIRQQRERVMSTSSAVSKRSSSAIKKSNVLTKVAEDPQPVRKENVTVSKTPKVYTKHLVVGTLIIGAVVGLMFVAEAPIAPVSSAPSLLELHKNVTNSGELRDAIDKVSQEKLSMAEREQYFDKIIDSRDPLAQDVLVQSALHAETPELRRLAEKAIVDRARRQGLMRSAEQVRQWLSSLGNITDLLSSYEPILRALDDGQPVEMRAALLRQAYAIFPKIVLRLTAALALDKNRLSEYQGVLAQLIGDSLKMEGTQQRSAGALILAHPEIASVFGEDIIKKRAELADSDILWLLELLSQRNDLNVRAIAALALDRKLVSPLRGTFLILVRDRSDLPTDVLNSLIRASAGTLKLEDIATFGRWYDVACEGVLFAIAAGDYSSELVLEAFDTLTGRSIISEPSASLIEWIRKNYWERRANFVKAVAAIAMIELVGEEEVLKSFKVFDGFVKDFELIDILIGSNNTAIVEMTVNKYWSIMGLRRLIDLMDHHDRRVRIAVVRAMKDFNDVGAIKLIIDHYEKESDAEVKKVYSDTFWFIKQRQGGVADVSS